MKTRTCSLLALAGWLFVSGAYTDVRAQGSGKGATSPKGGSYGEKTAFVISKIDAAVAMEFQKAWKASHNGVDWFEGLVLVYKASDGSLSARSQRTSYEPNRFTFQWTADIMAVVHTHRNGIEPKPEGADLRLADRFQVPVFTLTLLGMFVYDPETRKISIVRRGLDWLKPSNWNYERPAAAAQQALQYFEKTKNGDLENYLKRIRPAGVSVDGRERLLASIKKEDIVLPSPQRQAKLDALRPILAYHDRVGIEVKILRLGLAWAGMLEGAAVVVSEEAVDILTAEELQAVVAHELGHEYFAAEYAPARNNKQYDKVKEVELRCDAVAIITMKSLGLNPNCLLSGVSRLTQFNEARGVRTNPNLVTSLDERLGFCEAMVKLAEVRISKARETASK